MRLTQRDIREQNHRMISKAATVKEYLAELPEDRRSAIQAVRKVMRKHVPKGIKEGMSYGGIGYFVPYKIYPAGYHCEPRQPLPFAGLASQKNHMSLSLFCSYCDPKLRDWFVKQYKASGKKLDMGKACVRFRKLEDLPLDVVARTLDRVTIEDFIACYEKIVKRL